MEVQLPLFNLISFCLFFSFITLVLKQWMKPKTGKLPPGPWKLPLIGNMHCLVGAIPHVALRDLSKKYGKDLMHLQLGQVSVVVVSSAEVAKVFLKTHDLDFANRPRVVAGDEIFYDRSDIIFSPYGDYWKQMRKACMTELLSARTVRSFSYIRQDEIHRLLDRVRSSSGRPINIVEEMFIFTSSIVCRAAFGKIVNRTEELLKVMEEIMILSSSFCMADTFPSWKILHFLTEEKSRMVKVRQKADEIMGNIIKEHRNNLDNSGKTGSGESGVEDLVDVLIKLKDSNTLPVSITDDNIKSVILDMFGGGVDTSTTTTVCAMVEMMKNPRVLAKAQAEVRQVFKGKQTLDENDVEHQLAYLNLVIKETLRLHPPGSVIYRECKKESAVCGYTIPPKTRVLINAWAISRDPEYWEDPESFKPERFEDNPMDFNGSQLKYMPFGAGRRMCPGISFGLANVYTPLANLLYHFDWKLPHGITPHTLKLTEIPGLTLGVKNDIFFIAAPPAHAA